MHALVIGAAGMIGRKLTTRLLADGRLAGHDVERLTLYDVVAPEAPGNGSARVEAFSGDLAAEGEARRLADAKPDVIFHLAAVVSGEAEQDFDKGYRVNVEATWKLFEAVRAAGNRPRLVFTSSIAVFGAPFPERIPDEFHLTPLTSYGTQKAIGELLLADYTRKGFFDGVGIRLPTIVVRPGKPNKAASGFFSGIIREPLAGQVAVCPVGPEVRHWAASPRAAVEFLVHAAGLSPEALDTLGARRSLTMPGIDVTVGGMLESLKKVAGERVANRVRFERDPFIERIVAGWPQAFDASRARALGFKADPDFESIIRGHIADELGGRVAA